MPTISEPAGVDYPDGYEGRDIEPMRGRSMVGQLDGSRQTV